MNKNHCTSKGCPYINKKTAYFPLYEVKYTCSKLYGHDITKIAKCPME